jgi:PAS domain S-box-containing protein
MTATSVQSLITALLASAAIAYVATRRRQRTSVHWLLMLVLGLVAIWTGGMVFMYGSSSDAIVRFGLTISFLGAAGLGPAWLLLALSFARRHILERSPGFVVAVSVPSALFFLALVTNDGHRMFAHSLRAADLQAGPLQWAGPLYWASLVWSFVLVLAGLGVLSLDARRIFTNRVRMRGLTFVLAGAVPTLATASHYFGLISLPADPTPLATMFAILLVLGVVMRYRLLNTLPIARRDVIEHLADAVIIADAEGSILDLNPAAEALLGLPAGQASRAPLSRTIAQVSPDDDRHEIARALDDLEGTERIAFPLRTRDGRDLLVDAGCVQDGAGESTGQYAVLRDVTEARRYERLIRESQQRVIVGGLAAGIAHEVNNPLAFVASNLQQIHRSVGFGAQELAGFEPKRAEELGELRDVVEETIDGVERIAEIIGRIIRPGGAMQGELSRLEVGQVVRDAVQLAEFHRQYLVPIRVRMVDGLPEIEGSPERLSQAFLNLLLNAQQAGSAIEGGLVSIDAGLDGAAVRIRFRIDSSEGVGHIPGSAELSTTDQAEAELSAAYEIVREHGGTLESGTDDALFSVRLPAQPSLPRRGG